MKKMPLKQQIFHSDKGQNEKKCLKSTEKLKV